MPVTNTIRFRVTLAYAAFFALSQLVLWGVVDLVRTAYLKNRFDAELSAWATSFSEAVEDAPEWGQHQDFWPKSGLKLSILEQPTVAFVLRDEQGNTWASSPWASETLRSEMSGDTSTTPQVGTVSIPEQANSPERQYRIRRWTSVSPAGKRFNFYAAVDLEPLEHAIKDVRRVLVIMGAISFFLVTTTAWFFAGRVLQPLRRIANRTRKLGLNQLDRRIEVDAPGEEIALVVKRLNEMLARLERQAEEQRRFLGVLSHEFRTPLTVLLAEATNMESRAEPKSTTREFASNVRTEARRLLRTLEGFAALSRVRDKPESIKRERVDLEEVVLLAIKHCQREARLSQVRLAPQLIAETNAETPEPWVLGNEELLVSAIENLLHNAIRHSPANEVVEIHLSTTPDKAVIRVCDHGPGVPEKLRKRIFQAYDQGDSNQKGVAGLGLAIVQRVTRYHKGSIAVQEAESGGAEFVLRLPLAQSR